VIIFLRTTKLYIAIKTVNYTFNGFIAVAYREGDATQRTENDQVCVVGRRL